MFSLNTRLQNNRIYVNLIVSELEYVRIQILTNDVNLLYKYQQYERYTEEKTNIHKNIALPEPQNPRKSAPIYVGLHPTTKDFDYIANEFVNKINDKSIQLSMHVPKTLEELILERELTSSA
jgi:hypothetical protein